MVQIKTKAVPSPRSSPPPREEKQSSPPADPSKIKSLPGPPIKSTNPPEPSPSMKPNNQASHANKSAPKIAAISLIPARSTNATQEAMTSSVAVTSCDVVLGEGSESLMPRSLSTITPEAVKRSNENTRRIISRLLVNEDLRIPQKETKLDPEAQAERDKLLKRITPKVAPIVSFLSFVLQVHKLLFKTFSG